jgi:hypothetical protein
MRVLQPDCADSNHEKKIESLEFSIWLKGEEAKSGKARRGFENSPYSRRSGFQMSVTS